jgi:hypothetical protein
LVREAVGWEGNRTGHGINFRVLVHLHDLL